MSDFSPDCYSVKRSPNDKKFRVKHYLTPIAQHAHCQVMVTKTPGESDEDCLARAYAEIEQGHREGQPA